MLRTSKLILITTTIIEYEPTCPQSAGEVYLPILCVQRPTIVGCWDVQALGSTVSKALDSPCIIENPETLAVMMPSVTDAKAVVLRWPMVTTEACSTK
jgi:hypothetical protein